MEHHCKSHPATWGLEPASPVSVVNRNTISSRPSIYLKLLSVASIHSYSVLFGLAIYVINSNAFHLVSRDLAVYGSLCYVWQFML